MRRRGDMALAPMPRTVTALPAQENPAPSSSRQLTVASMSWERATLVITLSPWARAAAMSRRWAWDLEGGGVTVPASPPGVMVISIEIPPYGTLWKESSRRSSSSLGSLWGTARPIRSSRMRVMSAPAPFLSRPTAAA